jgi:outer membrane protein assembly factor BamB
VFIPDRYLVWRRQTSAALVAPPVVASRLVVTAGSSQSSVMAVGRIDAWDTATGEQCWSFSGDSGVGLDGGVAGIVLTPEGDVCFAQGSGVLRRLDRRSGEEQWHFGTGKAVHTAPILAADLVLLANDDGTLSAVDMASGIRRWTFQAAGVIRASPADADGHVLVASWDGRLHALELDGRVCGSVDLGSVEAIDPVPARPTRIVADADLVVLFDVSVRAIRAFSSTLDMQSFACSERWRVQVGAAADVAPLLFGDRVCWVQEDDGLVTCVDARSGRMFWTQSAGDAPLPGVMAGGTLMVATRGGQLAAFDPSSGQVLWRLGTSVSFSSPPAIVDSMAYVGGMDRTLYAIRLP